MPAEHNRRSTDTPEGLSQTKEKILFTTNELVIELNTQVAVLRTSNDNLKATVEAYMQKMDRVLDRVDERHAIMDGRITLQRTDFTRLEGKVDAVIDDVKELKGKSNLIDFINLVITGLVAALAYIWGK